MFAFYNAQTNPREWDGIIDEIMYFNEVVETSQVQTMYRVGAKRKRD